MLLTESQFYQWEKENLSRADRLRLRFVEDEIARDPSVGGERTQLLDGGIADRSAPGLLVEYYPTDSTTVELRHVYDLQELDPGRLVE
jgi:hypothetical protein